MEARPSFPGASQALMSLCYFWLSDLRIILRDLEAGTFRFRDFYERRARRILPALLIVLLASLPLAWISLTPKAAIEYAGSLLASLASVSNFWFWSEDSYTAEASLLKPLLHTWSLSVEEQFYLVTLAVLTLLRQSAPKQLSWFLAIGLLGSLLFADQLSRTNPEAAFFLLPTRAWELLAGGLLASTERLDGHRHRGIGQVLSVAALGILVISSLAFEDAWPHPSILTAVPVGATVILLATTAQDGLAGRILCAPAMQYLGRISYSLYLWHMPLFAFARNMGWPDDDPGKLGLLLISVLLAAATHRFIENPMRWAASRRMFWAFTIVAGVVLAAAGLYLFATGGTAGRPTAIVQAEQSPGDTADVDLPGSRFVILNVGDSHSSALSGGLHAAALANGFSMRSISSSGTLPVEGLYYLAGGKFDQRYGPEAVSYVNELLNTQIAGEIAQGERCSSFLAVGFRFISPIRCPSTRLRDSRSKAAHTLSPQMDALSPVSRRPKPPSVAPSIIG